MCACLRGTLVDTVSVHTTQVLTVIPTDPSCTEPSWDMRRSGPSPPRRFSWDSVTVAHGPRLIATSKQRLLLPSGRDPSLVSPPHTLSTQRGRLGGVTVWEVLPSQCPMRTSHPCVHREWSQARLSDTGARTSTHTRTPVLFSANTSSHHTLIHTRGTSRPRSASHVGRLFSLVLI